MNELTVTGYRRSRDIPISASQDEVHNVCPAITMQEKPLTHVGRCIVSLKIQGVEHTDCKTQISRLLV